MCVCVCVCVCGVNTIIERNSMLWFLTETIINFTKIIKIPYSSNESVWEICKLCSNKEIPHKGAGSAVFKAAMNWALEHGAEKLFILSNSRLKAALHIYRKYGFKEIKLDDYEYVRGDIAFEYKKEDCDL